MAYTFDIQFFGGGGGAAQYQPYNTYSKNNAVQTDAANLSNGLGANYSTWGNTSDSNIPNRGMYNSSVYRGLNPTSGTTTTTGNVQALTPVTNNPSFNFGIQQGKNGNAGQAQNSSNYGGGIDSIGPDHIYDLKSGTQNKEPEMDYIGPHRIYDLKPGTQNKEPDMEYLHEQSEPLMAYLDAVPDELSSTNNTARQLQQQNATTGTGGTRGLQYSRNPSTGTNNDYDMLTSRGK